MLHSSHGPCNQNMLTDTRQQRRPHTVKNPTSLSRKTSRSFIKHLPWQHPAAAAKVHAAPSCTGQYLLLTSDSLRFRRCLIVLPSSCPHSANGPQQQLTTWQQQRCQVLALLVIQLCHRLSWLYLVKQGGIVAALGPLAHLGPCCSKAQWPRMKVVLLMGLILRGSGCP